MSAGAATAAVAGAPPVFTLDSVPRLGKGFRLQYEPAQSAHVLLYPEGMVTLNGSAGAILSRCDGVADVRMLVEDLEAAFDTTGLESDVLGFLDMACTQRWVDAP